MMDNDDSKPVDESALTKAFLAIYRQKQRNATGKHTGAKFSRVVDHFERRAKRLEQETQITRELMGNLAAGLASFPPPPRVSTLEITGKPGGQGVGHVRIVNESSRPARASWVVGEPVLGGEVPPLSFAPSDVTLAPGEACFVAISADLGGYRQAFRVATLLECRTADRMSRLHLIIRVED